jgi:hypothetical protein
MKALKGIEGKNFVDGFCLLFFFFVPLFPENIEDPN